MRWLPRFPVGLRTIVVLLLAVVGSGLTAQTGTFRSTAYPVPAPEADSRAGAGSWGVTADVVRPTGRFGKIFGGSPGLELRYTPAGRSRCLRVSFTVGGFHLLSYRDTTASAYLMGNPGSRYAGFSPAYEVHKLFLGLTAGVEAAYYLLPERRVTPFGYLTAGANYLITNTQTQTRGIVANDLAGQGGAGLGLGVGIRGNLSSTLAVRLVSGRYDSILPRQGFLGYWRAGIGLVRTL